METRRVFKGFIFLAGLLCGMTIFALLSFKSYTPLPDKIESNISYFTDYKGCEWMMIRNHTTSNGLNSELVNSYFQAYHMPTCNNFHCK